MIYVRRALADGSPPVVVRIPEGADLVSILAMASRYGQQLSDAEWEKRGRWVDEWKAANAKSTGVGPGEVVGAVVAGSPAGGRGRTQDIHRAPLSGPARDPASIPPAVAGRRAHVGDRGSYPPDQRTANDPGDLLMGMGAAAGVRSTSLEAHKKLKASGQLTEQQKKVMAWVRAQPGDVTRGEISAGTGLPINAVTGRVHELLHDFEVPQMRETRLRRCHVSGESANALAVA